MEAVICENLCKTYGSGPNAVQAVKHANLVVQPGQLVMIMGPSGSGKTTFISVVAGILPYEEGSCHVFGEDYSTMNEEQRTRFRRDHIGFVFQAFNLVPMLTAVENVAVPLILQGVPRQEAEERARALLIELDLKDRVDATPNELSGGQQQRLAIARGCIHDPKLIVCDEPTAYLDHKTGDKVMEILKNKALTQNRAVIVVTHDSRIMHYADRIVEIEDGILKEKTETGSKLT